MTKRNPRPYDVSAVVCTQNSITSIRDCLNSLRDSGVGEIVVVDAASTDGTREVADGLATLVLEDDGSGLGQARNMGIAASSKDFILNMGSDNVMPPSQLQRMLDWLVRTNAAGVSACTTVTGSNYVTYGLNVWRSGRFMPGPAVVIGTPTLFEGDLLRTFPYDDRRKFSDDSELCERWARDLGAKFEVSDARVDECGKSTWAAVKARCKMYGESDAEVWRNGVRDGWPPVRRLKSALHPLNVDFLAPLRRQKISGVIRSLPFLTTFVALRYLFWLGAMVKN